MKPSTVDQAKLDGQRGVVRTEKRQRANAPFGAVPDLIDAAVFAAAALVPHVRGSPNPPETARG